MRRAFFFDQEKCMGCNTCTVACKDWNFVNPGPVRWRGQITHEYDNSFFPLSLGCNHCDEPACAAACAAGAIEKKGNGAVIVDRSKCVQFRTCIDACPFGVPQIADDNQEPEAKQSWAVAHPMQKCDFCAERANNGQQAICVASCPAHALDAGDLNELKVKYPDAVMLTKAEFPYAYEPGAEDTTGPAVLIRKRKSLEIIKSVDAGN